MRELDLQISCFTDSLTIEPYDLASDLGDICPAGACGFVPGSGSAPDDCDSPPLCGDFPEPPPCDPRCAVVDCCGGPLPPLDRPSLLLAWAVNAKVVTAQNVQVARFGSEQFEILKVGDVLQYGDIVKIARNGKFLMNANGQEFSTPAGQNWGKSLASDSLNLQITGERALTNLTSDSKALGISELGEYENLSKRRFKLRNSDAQGVLKSGQTVEFDPSRSPHPSDPTPKIPEPLTDAQFDSLINENLKRKKHK